MKNVDIEEPTSFLDDAAGATEKLPGWDKTLRKNFSVVLRHGGTEFRVPAWMITISMRRNLNLLGNCQKFAPILFFF